MKTVFKMMLNMFLMSLLLLLTFKFLFWFGGSTETPENKDIPIVLSITLGTFLGLLATLLESLK